MSGALDDGVDFDITTIRANLLGALTILQRHPHYGKADEADGEMLCEAGTILMDARPKLDVLYDKLDRLEVVSEGATS